jgi:DNA-binding response OmpR family regulator
MMKILIAEDDLTSRAVLSGVLKMHGYEVIETSNGREAWLALQQPEAPRLVLLDWMMPEMDGPEVLRQVRALQTDRPPYIIMLTAKCEKPHVIAGLDAGANDYLVKPFDAGELLARVEVGQRVVEMQLRRHQQRANTQRIRVETNQRLHEMQEALDAKARELRQSQAELDAAAARLQAARDEERANLTRKLRDSLGAQLSALQTDLMGISRHLQAHQGPDLEQLSGRVLALVPQVARMSEQISTFDSAVEGIDTHGRAADTRDNAAAAHDPQPVKFS